MVVMMIEHGVDAYRTANVRAKCYLFVSFLFLSSSSSCFDPLPLFYLSPSSPSSSLLTLSFLSLTVFNLLHPFSLIPSSSFRLSSYASFQDSVSSNTAFSLLFSHSVDFFLYLFLFHLFITNSQLHFSSRIYLPLSLSHNVRRKINIITSPFFACVCVCVCV